ncbi:Uncharacterised protein [Mycobacterium tuberculosis]|uniref:Uncharacterized protein n=1 Tax=Mycobacterium tuberculosis TaxID=1773 RepID=A0A654U4Y5_MYCTX|nr:Uncharacterised protein [Mycobacterium tuberculosis]CFR98764.1 Uncharacterised protein [Mycobacterium tuberculosis]CKT51348.1 Uncharacterised protein [Mycobacterium tuberculosis]CNV26222.1 Uncharacterised protein [Mycobacterium tuberculosis]
MPGVGRRPLTLQMFTIDPPLGCACISTLACWETSSGASTLSSTIFRWKLCVASAASAYGEPPALLTSMSSRPCRSPISPTRRLTESSSRMSQRWNSYGWPSTARRAQVITVAPCSANTELMPAPTPRTPPVTKTTRPASPKLMASAASARVTVLAYQASACLGSEPAGVQCRSPPPRPNRASSRSPSTTRRSTPSRRKRGSTWPTR